MPKNEIISGTSSIHLNRKGRDQAAELAHRIQKGGGFHMVVSSDLPRAHDTAQIIATHTKAPVQTTKGLHPWHLGDLEGKPEAESEAIVQHHARNMPWAPLPGKSPESGMRGESFNDFKNRLTSATKDLQETAKANPGMRIGAVTHSRSIHLIRAAQKGGDKFDHDEMFRKDPPEGHIFRLHDKGLQPMDNEEHYPGGVYLVRHTATDDDSNGR